MRFAIHQVSRPFLPGLVYDDKKMFLSLFFYWVLIVRLKNSLNRTDWKTKNVFEVFQYVAMNASTDVRVCFGLMYTALACLKQDEAKFV